MRQRHVWNSLYLRDLEHPQINLPLVELIERIMIRAEVFWQAMPANRSLERTTQRYTINDAMNTKPDDAACKLVHEHENPICSQCRGFAAE